MTPDYVHVLARGRIVKSGSQELALRLEQEGYAPILREAGLEEDAVAEEAAESVEPAEPAEPAAAGAGH